MAGDMPDREELIRQGIERFKRGELRVYRPLPSLPSPKLNRQRKVKLVFWALFLILTVICLWILKEPHNAELQPEIRAAADRQHEACSSASIICQQFVRLRIPTPATAKFGPPTEEICDAAADGSVIIGSYVDSQNLSGATVRQKFACAVKPSGGDRWKLIRLEFLPWQVGG